MKFIDIFTNQHRWPFFENGGIIMNQASKRKILFLVPFTPDILSYYQKPATTHLVREQMGLAENTELVWSNEVNEPAIEQASHIVVLEAYQTDNEFYPSIAAYAKEHAKAPNMVLTRLRLWEKLGEILKEKCPEAFI